MVLSARAPRTYNHRSTRRVFLLCLSLSFLASGALESSRAHFPPVPTVSRDPAVSFFSIVVSCTEPPLFSFSISSSCVSSLRESLSSHYYCPILPLTSSFMPPRRSPRCHSNLRWLTTIAIKDHHALFSLASSFCALFNTRRLIFHRAISPSSPGLHYPCTGEDRLGSRDTRRCAPPIYLLFRKIYKVFHNR